MEKDINATVYGNIIVLIWSEFINTETSQPMFLKFVLSRYPFGWDTRHTHQVTLTQL